MIPGRVAVLNWSLYLLLCGCVGTADIAIEVRANILDSASSYYERCTLSLYQGSSDKLVASRVVYSGKVAEWFTVSTVSAGISFGVHCDGSKDSYRSTVFGGAQMNPARLGVVELERR